ncbi:unnamed protein product, partial [Prorocentrum cordatum]
RRVLRMPPPSHFPPSSLAASPNLRPGQPVQIPGRRPSSTAAVQGSSPSAIISLNTHWLFASCLAFEHPTSFPSAHCAPMAMESLVPKRLLALCSSGRAPVAGAAVVFLAALVLADSDQQSGLLTAALIAAAGLLGLYNGGEKKVNAGVNKATTAKKAFQAEGLAVRGGAHGARAPRGALVPRPRKLGDGAAGIDGAAGAGGPPAGDDERLGAAMRSLREDASPTVTSFAVAMDVCNKRNLAETALEIFDVMLTKGVADSQHAIDRRTAVRFFKLVVHSIGDERMRQDGLRLLDAIRAHGLSPAVGAQDHLIVAWRSKLPEHVVAYFVKMREEGIILSWTAYRCIMSAYQWSDPAFALTLYDELTERGVRPDRVHFNAALTAYCELGRMDKAMQLLKDGPSLRVEPNAQTYQIVVRACVANDKLEEALALFNEMLEAQISPYRATYHDAVFCCVKLKRYDDAVAMCNVMTPGNRRPNEEAGMFLRRICQRQDWSDTAALVAEDFPQVRKAPAQSKH